MKRYLINIFRVYVLRTDPICRARIYMKSGNVVTLDGLIGPISFKYKDNGITELAMTQVDSSGYKLSVESIALDQIEAITLTAF